MTVPAPRRPADERPADERPAVPPTGYAELIAALVDVANVRIGEEEAARTRYEQQLSATASAVTDAEAAVVATSERAARCADEVQRVDYAAARLWGDLGNRLSRRAARRRGPVPAPDPIAVGAIDTASAGSTQADSAGGAHADSDPQAVLRRARRRLLAAPVVQVLATWAYPLMIVVAILATTIAAQVPATGTTPPWLRTGLLLAAPIAALAGSRAVAAAQRCRLDGWAVALTLGAGYGTALLVLLMR